MPHGLLGNRGLIAIIAQGEIDPLGHPLGAGNRLIVATGPLAGTAVSSAARISVGGKSPLTGGIKEANGGGEAGRALASLDLRAIIVEGLPPRGPDGKAPLRLLVVSEEGAHLEEAGALAGKGTYETAALLRSWYGERAALLIIGPAGEMRLPTAGVFATDPDGQPGRACARGGMGAVMGAKGLKAIVIVPGNHRPKPAQPERFRKAAAEFHRLLRETPQTGKFYREYGTAYSVGALNALGAMPTRNFTVGSFEHADALSGERLRELMLERGGKPVHACMRGCIIQCSNVYVDGTGRPLVSPLEYETLVLMGSNLGIGDPDQIARLNYLANDIGVDTIETGAAIGLLMGEGEVPFGDGATVARLLEEIRRGSAIGRLIGCGAATVGRALGTPRVPVVKGQSFAAHEARAVKGMAITYGMTPMGADHSTGVTFRAKVDHSRPEGQMELSRDTQVRVAAYDALGFCLFVTPAVGPRPEVTVELLNAMYDLSLPPDYITDLGKWVILTERAFNLAAGLGPAHDRLPEFMYTEPLPPTGLVVDIPQEDLDRYWEAEYWGTSADLLSEAAAGSRPTACCGCGRGAEQPDQETTQGRDGCGD
ncbi:MAG: aldehyde ferredoxin oxidoreductase C-terminal domain-containing protein [Bacillota bacterium]|nr:aldehyde ferredoxin oxidoreductase C-terminal domain-containing protein [Bacillota bacterium]MDI7249421.1 aldehyde ferredoxin oxidoreductase C-terminal domain-containing protein [Bacillota bacterium]